MVSSKIHQRSWRSKKKERLLLLLKAGLVLGLSHSAKQQLRVIKATAKIWKEIGRHDLYRLIREFHRDKLVDYRELGDGAIKISLTERGQHRQLQFDVDKLAVQKPFRWDRHWHLVFFDIPEKKRAGRDAFRKKLRGLGFYEWQKSVFVFPYPCREEIEFLVEFFDLRPYVRYGILSHPFNEAELKLHFEL